MVRCCRAGGCAGEGTSVAALRKIKWVALRVFLGMSCTGKSIINSTHKCSSRIAMNSAGLRRFAVLTMDK